MFNKGDRIHLHDGTVHTIRRKGSLPPRGRRARSAMHELPVVRGFIRGALVDPDGTEHIGEWHENVITVAGHGHIVNMFAGISTASAKYWAVGYQTLNTGVATDLWTISALQTEYALDSGNTGVSRATITGALAGTWSLTQSFQYASSQLISGSNINCVAQCSTSSKGAGSVLSFGLFSSSSKGSNQALNITYNWAMGSAVVLTIALGEMVAQFFGMLS